MLDVAVTGLVIGGAALADLSVFTPHTPTGRMLIGEAVLVTVLAWAVRRHTPAHPARGAALGLAAALVSVAVSAVVAVTVLQRSPGLLAGLGLAAVVVTLCRHLPGRWLVAVPVVAGALLALPVRLPSDYLDDLPAGATGPAGAVACAAVAVGLLLRSGDVARRAAQDAVLRGERLRLAHDLHDDVAHHVTGVVVAAQAGAQVAFRDPEQARVLFERIESTGQDGLVAIGRAVRLLRTGPDGAPATPPTLDAVRDLVHRFSRADVPTTLDVADGFDDRVCTGARWALGVRVVQEALTNVRKHAAAATGVRVAIDGTAGDLTVAVHNDGAGTPRRRGRPLPSGGAGLPGLAEQVGAFGGEFVHGPDGAGGWTVTARIPGEHR
ncbi:hypothetical protein AFB00_25570 [Pseudonocardia sp. HH130630-07]|nr:hypothetical protein AFB00_25570 [Pseudonocardia sp. HH130630-07]